MLDPIPRRSHRVLLPVSSSVASAFPQEGTGSAPAVSREHDFPRGSFSRLQIFLYVQASKFACLPDRSYAAVLPQGSRDFYFRAERASLPPHAPDMLTVRIQAIDGTRTFTLLDSQPCRLLILPSCYSSYGALNSYPGGTFTHCSCQPSLDAHVTGL